MTTRASLAWFWALSRNLPRWLSSSAHRQLKLKALRCRMSNQGTIFIYFHDGQLIGPVIVVVAFVVAIGEVCFWAAVEFSWM